MAIAEGTLVFLGARYIAVIVPVVIIILYALGVFYLRTSRQMRFLDLQAKAPLYTHLLETIDGLTTIRAFGWQTSVRETGNKLLDVSLRPYYLLFLIQRWLNVVLDMFVAVVAFLLVTFAVLLAEPTASAYVALAMYNVVSFNSTLAQLVSSWTSLETSLGAISRLRTFEEKTPTERPPAQEVNVPNGWPGRGAISLHNISASHPTGDKELDLTSPSAFVLKDITFDIKPGEKIGICGRTGSGKSSLIATLSRLLELNKGRILVDGIDISNIDLATLRGNLISVPQQPVLFPETIRLHLGQTPSSDEALIDVLVKVGLWDMVRSHQGTAGDGLNAEVIGLPLSHGQKQLMCFARALLQRDRCKVLLLDEVTSALDRDTEQLIMRLIHTEFREHTVISVAHHLETLRGFDRVIVMERGGVAEAGEPEELLKKPGGKYRELWKVGEQGMG